MKWYRLAIRWTEAKASAAHAHYERSSIDRATDVRVCRENVKEPRWLPLLDRQIPVEPRTQTPAPEHTWPMSGLSWHGCVRVSACWPSALAPPGSYRWRSFPVCHMSPSLPSCLL